MFSTSYQSGSNYVTGFLLTDRLSRSCRGPIPDVRGVFSAAGVLQRQWVQLLGLVLLILLKPMSNATQPCLEILSRAVQSWIIGIYVLVGSPSLWWPHSLPPWLSWISLVPQVFWGFISFILVAIFFLWSGWADTIGQRGSTQACSQYPANRNQWTVPLKRM